jgi:hypothetical protein
VLNGWPQRDIQMFFLLFFVFVFWFLVFSFFFCCSYLYMCVFVCFVQTLQWLTPWRHPTASIQQSFTIADTCVMASSSIATAKTHYDLLCFIWLRLPFCLFSLPPPLHVPVQFNIFIYFYPNRKMATELMIKITGNHFDNRGAFFEGSFL